MAEYLAPGVYVEETSFRQKTIEGASTSIAAIVGPTQFGQVRGRPVQCTSLADFENNFGDLSNLSFGGTSTPNYTALAVRAFFDNGGHNIYVARIAHNATDATAAALPHGAAAGAAASVLFQARFAGSGGNLDVVFSPRRSASMLSLGTSTSDADIVLLRLSQVRKAQLINPTAAVPDTLQKVVALAQHKPADATNSERYEFEDGQKIFYLDTAGAPHLVDVAGFAASITVDQSVRDGARKATLNAAGLGTGPLYSIPGGPALAQYLGATSTPTTFYATASADGTTLTFPHALNASISADVQLPIALAAADLAPGPAAAGALFHDAYDISVQRAGIPIYSVQGVSLEPNAAVSLGAAMPMSPVRSSDQLTQPIAVSYGTPVHNASDVWAALDNTFDPALRNPSNPAATPQLVIHLTSGSDGTAPTVADYIGEMNDQLGSYGLAALEDIDVVSMVICPAAAADPATHPGVVIAMQQHCNKMRYRMAIIESGPGSSVADVQVFRAQLSDTRLALYYPWVKAASPDGNGDVVLPPSGFIAGLYADTDVQRGVHKAPANEVIQGVTGLELYVNTFQQEVLNPVGINCLRLFANRGYRVWGGRTLSDDPDWRYVNVRRYFMFLEHSIDDSTSWVVFEPNGEALWANVQATVSDFLYSEWRNGHLLGAKPEQAYFVRCDRTTMTQNDLDNGRLVCLIGVAPLQPAEFVIFRIGQITASA
jgi:phage tail sheath protein FI